MRVTILDNGVGNLANLANYVERELGERPTVTDEPAALWRSTDLLVLPGVGNFGALAAKVGQLRDTLSEYLGRGGHLLGICLGMQLLYEQSEEGPTQGLGLLSGRVVRLPRGLRVPRIGWAPLKTRGDAGPWGVLDGLDFYYAHSYYAAGAEHVVGHSTYGPVEVPSLVVWGRLVATQFHPERSGGSGRLFAATLKRYVRR